MWEKIEAHRREPLETPKYFSSSTVRPNLTGVLCPENGDTLKVRIDNKTNSVPVPIHANYVQLSTTGCYAVGQSPDDKFELGCTRDLIHSLDSGRGLFQFTSRSTHRCDGGRGPDNATIRNEASLSTIASMVVAERQRSGGLPMLGERYQITKFEALPSDRAEKDVTRYELTATDIHTNESRTVYITQAGLRFVHKLLEPDKIARAAALLDTHPQSIPATPVNNAHAQTGPLICSAAGIGRSAVLAVYQDLCKRMPGDVNESNLDAHLEAAIKRGIETRGPMFLHSKKQVEALREALVTKMREGQGAPFESQNTRQNLLNQLRPHDGSGTAHLPNADSVHAADTLNPTPQAAQKTDHSSRSAHPRQVPDAAEQNEERDTDTPLRAPRKVAVSDDAAAAQPHPAHAPHADNSATAAAAAGQRGTQSDPFPPAAHSDESNPAPTAAEQVSTDPALADEAENTHRNAVRFAPHLPVTGRRSQPTSVIDRDPNEVVNAYRIALNNAAEQGEKSITFPAHVIDMEPPTSENPVSLPVVRTAALAIATIQPYIHNPATSVESVQFEFANAAQKEVYRDLLGRVDTLTPHRVFQALQRPFIEDRLQSTPPEHFFEPRKLAVFAPSEINDAVDNVEEINNASAALKRDLNGIELDTWKEVPTSTKAWNDTTNPIDEPALPDNCHAVAAVIVEKDGRVWVVAPTNQRGKKKIAFPDGFIGNTSGLSAQACARKSAYEKSGLQIELTHHLTDIEDDFRTTRFYAANRIGGTPADAGWKSQAVCLVPIKKLRAMFQDGGVCNHHRERFALDDLQQSMLMTKLNRDATLARAREGLRKWVYYLAPILPRQPEYLDDPMSSMANTAKSACFQLSGRLSYLVDHWRENNFQLFDPIGARPGSAPVNAATALETPPGSIVSYLHANDIRADGCRIALIAAQRPQTGVVPANKVGTVRGLFRRLTISGTQPLQTEPAEQTDDRIRFWQTVLHDNVNVIVDLDDAKSRPRQAHYGPSENSHLEIGTHALVLTKAEQFGKVRIEQIAAIGPDGGEGEAITRLHYTAWPEGGTISAKELVDLARRVVLASEGRGEKVLVHSTLGTGRAGTLITFIAASEQISDLMRGPHKMRPEKLIDIVMQLVACGRAERGPGFVDPAHMMLLFEALLKEHFVGVTSTNIPYEGDLMGRAL